MRYAMMLVLLMIVGCQKASEKAVEAASGGKVEVKGDTVTIKTDEGTVTVKPEGEKRVVTAEDGTQVTMETSDEAIHIETAEGSMSFGTAALPEGFPLPLMPGAQVVQSAHMSPEGEPETFTLICNVESKVDEVTAFYDKALKDKGIKAERATMTFGDTTQVVLTGKSDAAEVAVNVMKQAGESILTLTVSWQAVESQ